MQGQLLVRTRIFSAFVFIIIIIAPLLCGCLRLTSHMFYILCMLWLWHSGCITEFIINNSWFQFSAVSL